MVPRVTRIGCTPRKATIAPVISPTTNDVTNPAASASAITPAMACGGLAGPIILVMMAAITRAERLALAMIARFSPPLINGIIMARARMPSSGIWKAMARGVSSERKREGANALKKITDRAITALSIVTVGSRLIQAMKEVRRADVELAVAALVGMTNALFLLILGGVSRGAHANENHKSGNEPE